MATKMMSGYMPPEMRCGQHLCSGAAQDMWSIGAVAHALLVGQPPVNNEWGTRGIFRGSFEEAWSERSLEARDFVARLLLPADERPTAAQMLNHPWLRSAAISEVTSKTSGGTSQEAQMTVLCYMLAVLLIPVMVPHCDFEHLRVAFIQMDKDNDGFIPRSAVHSILRKRCVLEEAVTTALNICDVGKTGVMDLCTAACADLISREFFASGPTSQPLSCPLRISDLVPRMLKKFFEKYGEQKQAPATVEGIEMRIRSAVAQDMESYTSVRYDEIIACLPEETHINEKLLSEYLSASSGAGTPLMPRAMRSLRAAEGPSCGVEGLDDLVFSFFQSCGFGSVGFKRHVKAGGC